MKNEMFKYFVVTKQGDTLCLVDRDQALNIIRSGNKDHLRVKLFTHILSKDRIKSCYIKKTRRVGVHIVVRHTEIMEGDFAGKKITFSPSFTYRRSLSFCEKLLSKLKTYHPYKKEIIKNLSNQIREAKKRNEIKIKIGAYNK